MVKPTVNITTKNIRDFNSKDTIYISKVKNGSQIIYFCQFNSFEKGMVYGNIISIEPIWADHSTLLGTVVAGRTKKCYLWGKGDNDAWETCQWFTSTGTI